MSSTVMLTGQVFNASRGAAAVDTVTVSAVVPSREDVSNVGVLDDGVLLSGSVTVAADSTGAWSVLVIPSADAAVGDDGSTLRYRVSFGAGRVVEVTVPDSDQPVSLASLIKK